MTDNYFAEGAGNDGLIPGAFQGDYPTGGPHGGDQGRPGQFGQQEQSLLGFKSGTLGSVQHRRTVALSLPEEVGHPPQRLPAAPGRGPANGNRAAFLSETGQIFPVLALTEHDHRVDGSVKVAIKNGPPVPGGPDTGRAARKAFLVKVRLEDSDPTGGEPEFAETVGQVAGQGNFIALRPTEGHPRALFFLKGKNRFIHDFRHIFMRR